jgi:hypothetical protein
LSVAAQHQNPTTADICTLNKRLEWQIKHMDKGIKYIALDLECTKLFVFVDGSFANNKDFSSQIGYLIIIANCWNSGMRQFRLLYICLSEQQHMTLSAPVHLSAAYI